MITDRESSRVELSLELLRTVMDFQSAMETFAEAWVAANAKGPLGDSGAQVRIYPFIISYLYIFLP